MSKKLKTTNSNFTYQPTTKRKKLTGIQTTWDLAGLYYASETDPQIEKDLKQVEQFYTAFAKKWNGRKFTANAKILL